MNYRVRYMPRVVAAIESQTEYLISQQDSTERVSAWLRDIYDLADSLEMMPRRHAVDVGMTEAVGAETRRVVFGEYLLYYQIDDTRKHVNVVHFRHGAQVTDPTAGDTAG